MMTPEEMDALVREDLAKGKELFLLVSDEAPMAAELMAHWMVLNNINKFHFSKFNWFLKTMGFEFEVSTEELAIRIHFGIMGKKGFLMNVTSGLRGAYREAFKHIHKMNKSERTDIEISEGFVSIIHHY